MNSTWPKHAHVEYCFLVLQDLSVFPIKQILQESSVNLSTMIKTLIVLLSVDLASTHLTESGLAKGHMVFLVVPPLCNLIPFHNMLQQLRWCWQQDRILWPCRTGQVCGFPFCVRHCFGWFLCRVVVGKGMSWQHFSLRESSGKTIKTLILKRTYSSYEKYYGMT